MLNNEMEFFLYKSGDLVYIISPLTSHLRTSSRKLSVMYVGYIIVYKIVDPTSFILCTLDGKLLFELFEQIETTSHKN